MAAKSIWDIGLNIQHPNLESNSEFVKKLFKSQLKIKTMSTGKVLLGLLAGIAAGATLGILFAPESGASTRKKISRKGQDYVDELEGKFNEYVDVVSKKYESVKGEMTQMAENGKARMDHTASEASAAVKSNMR